MNLEYLSIFGLIFLIWQIVAIFKIKNMPLEKIIKTNDLHLYKKNMWLSILSYLILLVLKYTTQNIAITTNIPILSTASIVQVGFCLYIIKFKSVLYDFDLISNMRSQGEPAQAKKILIKSYNRMYKTLFMMFSSYLNNNAHVIQDKNNKNILHYEPSLVTYLMDRIEDMINEFNLTKQLTLVKDRKALENKILQDKL